MSRQLDNESLGAKMDGETKKRILGSKFVAKTAFAVVSCEDFFLRLNEVDFKVLSFEAGYYDFPRWNVFHDNILKVSYCDISLLGPRNPFCFLRKFFDVVSGNWEFGCVSKDS